MHPVRYAIISAAGMGSRLQLNMPKCLVEIHGRKVIDYLLSLLVDIENVRIVVGFMEDEVINYVRRIRPDVVFVRNPHFQTTANTYSLWLATRDLKEPFFAIDGDMLIEPESFDAFLKSCDGNQSVVGIAKSKTDEAVFVELDSENKAITAFFREPRTPFEWCGIACLSGIEIPKDQEAYVFKILERHLPLRAHVISCFEIDTPNDLNYAISHFRPGRT